MIKVELSTLILISSGARPCLGRAIGGCCLETDFFNSNFFILGYYICLLIIPLSIKN